MTLPPVLGFQRVLFVVQGAGCVTAGVSSTSISESAEGLPFTYVPEIGSSVSIEAVGSTSLLALEVQQQLAPQDNLEACACRLPHALPYSAAGTYKEAIKSPKTTSRTLVPAGVVPRFAAGSVQTCGPDDVAPHAHPMLEQLFLGLPSCDCTVTADAASAPLEALDLLHIPLGSMHGVRVDEGKGMHYLWLDFFRDKAAEAWLDNHVDDASPPETE